MRRLITRLAILGVVLLIAAAIPGTKANREALHALGMQTHREVCLGIYTEWTRREREGAGPATLDAIRGRYIAAGCQ